MVLYLIGVDYNTANLKVREDIYKLRDEITCLWQAPGQEKAVLFTCNRIELYGLAGDIFLASSEIEKFRERFSLVFKHSYVKQGSQEVIEHALRLAVGLESQVKGEREILEQLRRWIRQEPFPRTLKRIWTEVLISSEEIRSGSDLNDRNNNIAGIIFDDLDKRFEQKQEKEIAVIGTGKVAQIFAENNRDGINLHFVARRKLNRAQRLARRSGGKAILPEGLGGLILSVDAMVSATSSPHRVLNHGHFSNIGARRKPPLYLYDLAMPRDVAPDVKDIPGVFLQDLDDLGVVFRRHNKELDGCIKKAELLILHHIFAIAEQVKENKGVYSYQGRDAA